MHTLGCSPTWGTRTPQGDLHAPQHQPGQQVLREAQGPLCAAAVLLDVGEQCVVGSHAYDTHRPPAERQQSLPQRQEVQSAGVHSGVTREPACSYRLWDTRDVLPIEGHVQPPGWTAGKA